LWNLEARESLSYGEARNYFFSFESVDWPRRPSNTRFTPLIRTALPLILIAAFVLVFFVGWKLSRS
jgi:hypothetical protein